MFWTKDFIAKNERATVKIRQFFSGVERLRKRRLLTIICIFLKLVLVMRLAQELSWQFLQTYINSINGFDSTQKTF